MEKSPTADQSVKETKSVSTSHTSQRKRSKLSTRDDSPLTAQDQIVLAMLGELKDQGYPFQIANVTLKGVKQAAIILPARLWS